MAATSGRCDINTISILGSGWLGKPLAEHLLHHDNRIKLSTRSEQKQAQLTQAGFDSFVVDIDQNPPASTTFLEADTLIINITNKHIESFKALIAMIRQSPIKHVLFISSSSVYQNLNREVSEDEAAENTDSVLYQIENLFKQETGFKSTILRFSGLIGPGRHPGRFFRSGKQVKQPDAPVNLIHLDDCIGIIDAILKQSAWQQTFNGCAGSHPTKRQFYSQMARLAGMPLPDFSDTSALSYKIVNNDKLKTTLHYRFLHPDLQKIDF
jgi:nucleoside-diphosphate-sugar epimerase